MPALSLTDISTAVQNSSVCIKVDELKNGTPLKEHGRLVCFAGNYGAVYNFLMPSGKQKALRIWTKDLTLLPDLPHRSKIISEQFNNINSKYFSSFNYYERGILVNGNWYPLIVMDWEKGSTLKDYLEKNLYDKGKLIRLANSFGEMTRHLHERHISHGDLQHGNVLIDENGDIKLIDYDSIYLPNVGFENKEEEIKGLPDYQHPCRMQNVYMTEKADYFSELIIYLSIRALAESPTLWEKYNVGNRDYSLLFDVKDFSAIKSSDIYKDIKDLGKEFQDLLDVLEAYLKCSSIDELLPFDTYLLENRITFTTSATKAVRNTQTITIEWNVPFEAEVSLKKGKDSDFERCENKGSISTTLNEGITYELLVKKTDCSEIRKQTTIEVFDECIIDFSADKYYIFPTIPVKLSWNVKHAKKVLLDNEEVNAIGTKVIEPKKATTCVLSAEDEIGVKEKRVDIQMLPIPQVKSLLVPVPDITNNLSVTIQQPRYNVDVKFPTIDIDWIKVEVPRVPSLTELGLNVELSPPLPKISLMSSIKRVFNHIIRK